MRERYVEHQCLENLPLPGHFREALQIAHHFQPVGDFEHSHPRVGRVLDNEFLVVLGLQPGILRLDGGDSVKSVHHLAYLSRETGNVDSCLGMLPHGLVEENRRHAFRRESYFLGNDGRHVHRMLNERMPVVPHIIRKNLPGRLPGPIHQIKPLLTVMRKGRLQHFSVFLQVHHICHFQMANFRKKSRNSKRRYGNAGKFQCCPKLLFSNYINERLTQKSINCHLDRVKRVERST